jgi:hypothetical protein
MRLRAGSATSRQVAAVALVALAVVMLGAPGFAGAKLVGIVPPRNPPANVAPNPNYDHCSTAGVCTNEPPCYSGGNYAPLFGSAACEQAEVAAIDSARAQEGVGPIYLPSDYDSLTRDEQLLVVIDLERVGRGLPPVAGIVASLDAVAQRGTAVAGAPAGSYEDPQFPAGFRVAHHTAFAWRCTQDGGGGFVCNGSGEPGAAIAAGGDINPLDADYGWMYNDGPGGSNADCRTPSAKGCWGHRDNILGRYPTKARFAAVDAGGEVVPTRLSRAVIVMGAGATEPNGGGGPQGNFAAIFASVVGHKPKFVYTWKQALAAGAAVPPA